MLSWLKRSKRQLHVAVAASARGLFAVSFEAGRLAPGAIPQLRACACLPGAELDEAGLRRLCERLGASSAQWTLVLEHRDYQNLTLEAPALPEDELERGLQWTLSEQIGCPAAELQLAWLHIPRPAYMGERAGQLFVIVTHKATIAARCKPFKDAGLDLKVLEIQETAQRNIATLAAGPQQAHVITHKSFLFSDQ